MVGKIISLLDSKFKAVLSGRTQKHLFWTFFVYFFVSVMMIVTKVVIARLYGQEELGVYSYFFSIASFLFLFTSLGFPEALTKKLAVLPQLISEYSWRSVIGVSVFSLLVFSLFYFFFPLASVSYLRLSFGLFVLSYSFYYLMYSILRGAKRFAEGSAYTLVWRMLFVLCLFVFVELAFWKLLLILSGCIFLAGLVQIPSVIAVWRKSSSTHLSLEDNSEGSANVALEKESFTRFFYLAVSLFLLQVGFYSLRTVDIYVIEYLLNFAEVGVYSAYASITNALRLVAYVFPVVVLPMAAVSTYKIRRSLQKISFVLVPFSVLIFISSVVFVPLFYGQEYAGQWLLALLMVISAGTLVVYSYLSSVFAGENSVNRFYLGVLFFDFVLSLGLNIGLNFWLIPWYGLLGAPIATIVTILFKLMLLVFAIQKVRTLSKKKSLINV